MRIDIDRSAGAVAIRAVRPGQRRNNQGARFAIKVPRTVVLERITASNGAIHTEDGVGPSHFRTSNGSVRVEGLHGRLDAETSNGPIDLVNADGDALLRTSNGHVDVRQLRGSLDATTSNSAIDAQTRLFGRRRAPHPAPAAPLETTAVEQPLDASARSAQVERSPAQPDAFAAVTQALSPEAFAAAHPFAAPPAAKPGLDTVPAEQVPAEQVADEQVADEAQVERSGDISAELMAAEEVTAEQVSAEEVTAVLTAVLDRLGAAHHRPFSRA